MKQKNKKILVIVIAVALLAGVYIYYMGGTPSEQGTTFIDKVTDKVSSLVSGVEDRGNNGWWNVEAQQCWSTPNNLQGGTKPSYSCCFDQEGYQVDCSGDKRLSDRPVVYAIFFPEGGESTPNKYSLAITMGVTNTANVDFSKVWVQTSDWVSLPVYASGESILDTRFNALLGSNNAVAVAIPKATTRYFPITGVIDLQSLSPGATNVIAYTGTVGFQGTYYIGTTLTNTTIISKTIRFTVEKEVAGFSIDVAMTAT